MGLGRLLQRLDGLGGRAPPRRGDEARLPDVVRDGPGSTGGGGGPVGRVDRPAARMHLLWGAATALVAGLVVPRAAGAVLAVGVLATTPTVIGSMLR